jgi:hypothetical protein
MFELLAYIPALVRIATVFAFVLLLLRLKIHLGLSMLVGSVMMAVFFAMPPVDFFHAVRKGFFSEESLFLVFIVIGILILSSAMNQGGQIQRIVDRFQNLVGASRITLVAFPAMIGLLPMPGGAVFSAPMVDAACESSDLSPTRKSIINYWFRHVWEYWFPLYPGVMLALLLSHLDPGRYVLHQLPMSLVAVLAGYMVILHSIRMKGERRFNVSPQAVGRFLWEMIPILLVVTSILVLTPLFRSITDKPHYSIFIKRFPYAIGLAAALIWTIRTCRIPLRNVGRLMVKRNVWGMVLLVLGLMVFRQTLEISGAVDRLEQELRAYHIPLVAVVAFLPFISGIVVGIAVGFVGLSFPTVLSLLESAGITGKDLLPYVFLAYAWGYAGMMASPVHLCLLLTRDYFRAELWRIYRRHLLPLTALTLTASTLLFMLYR